MPSESFKSYSYTIEDNKLPIAIIMPPDQEVVVGSIVKLDGRSSVDPEFSGLTYSWSFSQVPIGSQVEKFNFTNLEEDSSIVGFAPDITGTYKVQLVVSDSSLTSEPAESIVDVRAILVPHHQGFIPDASFIWNYLSDFWNLVSDKKKFEVFWSSAIQIAASEQLKLYQYQYNKSIRDIQDTIQKRWLYFSPSIALDRDTTTFILSKDSAGTSASTFLIDPKSAATIISADSYSNVIIVPIAEGNFVSTSFNSSVDADRIIKLGNRSFSMSRSRNITISTNFGSDGVSSGANTFTGSEFTSDMVGSTLRILSHSSTPSLVGDYVIAAFISSAQVTVVVPTGVTWLSYSGITYSVIPAVNTHSAFFADENQVPTGLENQNWRFSSTLLSSDIDFEEQGVSPGDIIEVEVIRTDTGAISNFFVQVVSVDKKRLGFAITLGDLVDGIAAPMLTQDIQVTLAADLSVTGLSVDSTGNLVYALDSSTINSTVNSTPFKKAYFEKELNYKSEINVGPFSITARPVQIIRNKKLLVDPAIMSAPILQEYIKQPIISRDGDKIVIIGESGEQEVPREPYLLSENLDYIIDDESMIVGACNVTQGIDEIDIPLGDLFDRSVQEGDIISIDIGTITNQFDIRRIVAADRIRVFPTPTLSGTAKPFTITRRKAGKYLRFVDGVFTKINPAPARLWSEVTYIDNKQTIEDNFGVLVGLKVEDLEKVGASIPYKSAVAGLMYALSRGPTVANMTLSAQILIGLPFAQTDGVITEINRVFRIREDGSPKFGRILIEGRDKTNSATGITNIYLYPLGAQVKDLITGEWVPAISDFSGLATNPATGEEYKVGDFVFQFAPLSKGVEIEEYLTTSEFLDRLIAQGQTSSQLQKYHSFQLVLNSDLLNTADIGIVASFMKKVRAHYTRMSAAILKSVQDTVDPTDAVTFGRFLTFFDSENAGLPSAFMISAADDNQSFLSVEGIYYTKYHSGDDLVTTKDSSTVTTAEGGVLDPRAGVPENWNSPKIRPGDLLSIESGNNFGKYPITSIINNNQMTLDLSGGNFESSTAQLFSIFRPLKNPIWDGKVNISTGDVNISAIENSGSAAGLVAAGVAEGDTLIFTDLSTLNPTVSRKYSIVSVDTLGSSFTVAPAPTEGTSQYNAWIVREKLVTKGTTSKFGDPSPQFWADTLASGVYITFNDTISHTNSWLNIALIRPGDLVKIDNVSYSVMRFEPANRRVLVTPPTPPFTDKQVTLELRPDRSTTVLSTDFLNRIPSDYIELTIETSPTTGDSVNTISGSNDVDLTVETFPDLLILPGDRLILLEGADSTVDNGNGPGVFPIKELLGTTARLMDTISATGNFRYSIKRTRPNEG
jgi:hypothetical protein